MYVSYPVVSTKSVTDIGTETAAPLIVISSTASKSNVEFPYT